MIVILRNQYAWIAQLGERQTEDLKVPGSIPGLGITFAQLFNLFALLIYYETFTQNIIIKLINNRYTNFNARNSCLL